MAPSQLPIVPEPISSLSSESLTPTQLPFGISINHVPPTSISSFQDVYQSTMHPTSAPTRKEQEFSMPTRLQVDASSRSNNSHDDYTMIIIIIIVIGFFLVAVFIGCLVRSRQRKAKVWIETPSHHQLVSRNKSAPAPAPLEVAPQGDDDDKVRDVTLAFVPGGCGLENVQANTRANGEAELCAQYWIASKQTVLVLEVLAGMSYHGTK
jgi:hypothetical protein